MSPTTVRNNYYAILGIPQSADSATIRSRYKRLVLDTHPDRNKEPNATAEFQLLQTAYEELYDVDKRREYDRIYRSTIGPEEAKNQKIAELEKRLVQLKVELIGLETLLRNLTKELVRLLAEGDSIKGEKERLVRERNSEERWWLYICSFMPGRAAEFTRQKQLRERVMTTMAGKQRTKEWNINLKLAEIKSLKESIQSIHSVECRTKVEIRRIEECWRQLVILQEMERVLAERRNQREQADRARAATQANYFTKRNSYNMWGF
ncbi:DnaJ domain protein [Penicillium robsamsonii]|uniref:DnaJ domain protein n=1 Tax=Penicillium robsamsonii TaxID=1792511 RepID=UPI002546DD12|nr:DnaJ domain protein [Penicillium robsamsonii]KAJ5835746.1 DnaJ domain protein [Penicillium robsamsonii]